VPVAGTPNNWVEVEKRPNGKYLAEVGKETFEVQIKVSLVDGRILSAKIDNPVEAISRECADGPYELHGSRPASYPAAN
jgi:hypothetical protein